MSQKHKKQFLCVFRNAPIITAGEDYYLFNFSEHWLLPLGVRFVKPKSGNALFIACGKTSGPIRLIRCSDCHISCQNTRLDEIDQSQTRRVGASLFYKNTDFITFGVRVIMSSTRENTRASVFRDNSTYSVCRGVMFNVRALIQMRSTKATLSKHFFFQRSFSSRITQSRKLCTISNISQWISNKLSM